MSAIVAAGAASLWTGSSSANQLQTTNVNTSASGSTFLATAVYHGSGAPSYQPVVDTFGNSYTQLDQVYDGGYCYVTTFAATGAGGANHWARIQLAGGATGQLNICLQEFLNCTGTQVVASNHNSVFRQTTSASPITASTGAISSLSNGGAIMAAIYTNAYFETADTFTEIDGFAIQQQSPTANDNIPPAVLATKVITASGTYQTGWYDATSGDTGNYQQVLLYVFQGALPQAQLAGAAQVTTGAAGALSTGIKLSGAAIVSSSVAATLTNWASVTLTAPLYTGVGGILDPNFWLGPTPAAGTVVYYDATNLTILPDGEFVSTTNNCQAAMQFNNGTGWVFGVVHIVPGPVSYASDTDIVTGVLSTAIQLQGAAQDLVSATGSLLAFTGMYATAQDVTSASGALTTAIKMLGTAIDATQASASLSNGIRLASTCADVVSAAGTLSTRIQIMASAITVSGSSGQLSTGVTFSGAAVSGTSASGKLSTGIGVQATAAISSAATGALMTQIRLAVPAQSIVTAAGTLTTQIKLLGNAVSSTSATGNPIWFRSLQASATIISNATGALTTQTQMSGLAWSLTFMAGSLSSQIVLTGSAGDAVIASGTLTDTGSAVGLYATDPFFVVAGARLGATQVMPPIAPGQNVIITFNFADQLTAPGATLEGQIATNVQVTSGLDPTPLAVLNGVPAYDPTLTEALVPVVGGVNGDVYYLTVTSMASSPNETLARFCLLPVHS